MRKTLVNLALAGTLALGLTGCGRPYEFKGKIGNEQVEYRNEGMTGNRHILQVTKPDKSRVKYISHFMSETKYNLVDEIEIVGNGQTNHYSLYELDQGTFDKIQNTYNEYLGKIVAAKGSIVANALKSEERVK